MCGGMRFPIGVYAACIRAIVRARIQRCVGACVCEISRRCIKSKSQGWSAHQGHSGSITVFNMRITAGGMCGREGGMGEELLQRHSLMPHAPIGNPNDCSRPN